MVDRYDPDEMLVCPYDPVHRIARKRFQGHIIKCRKNYNTKDFSVCPFNAKHVIPKPELTYHISNCEDRCRVEIDIYHNSSSLYKEKGDTSVPIHNWVPPPSEEDSWDDDNVKYVPTKPTLLFEEDDTIPATTHTPTISKPSSVVCPPPEVRMPKMPTNPSTVYSYSVTAGRGGLKHGRGEPPSISVGRGRGVGRGIVGIEQSNKSVGIVSLTNESELKVLRKNVRKLNKMLKQIIEIEKKQYEGVSLENEQIAKLSRKNDVMTSLEANRRELHNLELKYGQEE